MMLTRANFPGLATRAQPSYCTTLVLSPTISITVSEENYLGRRYLRTLARCCPHPDKPLFCNNSEKLAETEYMIPHCNGATS